MSHVCGTTSPTPSVVTSLRTQSKEHVQRRAWLCDLTLPACSPRAEARSGAVLGASGRRSTLEAAGRLARQVGGQDQRAVPDDCADATACGGQRPRLYTQGQTHTLSADVPGPASSRVAQRAPLPLPG